MSEENEVNGVAQELHPTQFLEKISDKGDDANKTTALTFLHSPVSDFESFRRLYHHSSYCLCVDGGANRLHDLLTKQQPELEWTKALQTAPPNLIHGDLDSLDNSVRERYEQIGVEISQDPDQYSTDFEKAMKTIAKRVPDVQSLLILGSLGGRVDHGVGLLHELYAETKDRHPGIRLWLLSEASISTVLQPGTTILHTPLKTGLIKRNMGILPLYGPAVISTQGLEWDVQDWPTEMGGQVSTSNHIVADSVTITTDNYVLFTVERATFS